MFRQVFQVWPLLDVFYNSLITLYYGHSDLCSSLLRAEFLFLTLYSTEYVYGNSLYNFVDIPIKRNVYKKPTKFKQI